MTHDEVLSALKKINKIEFDAEDYIFDLVNSICVLYRDGLNYKFTHRSFQEYFTAIFLKDLPDQNMKTMGMELIKKDYFKASHDNVFAMLHDMAEQRFEQNILLPLVIEFESTCQDDNKYDFFECPNLRKEKGYIIQGDSIDNLLDISRFVIIQGSGGIGKSKICKHLFKGVVR